MWKIVVTIIICSVVILCFAVAAARMKAREDRTWLPQPPGHRGAVQFAASLPGEHEFKIISVTSQLSEPPVAQPPTAGGGPIRSVGFITIHITENPAGICKMTGSQVKDCSCDRHRTRR